MDICCAPRVSSAALTDLELLLQCFFQNFKLVYLDEKITPTMHYLLIKVKVKVRDSGCKHTLFRPFSIVGPLQFSITND